MLTKREKRVYSHSISTLKNKTSILTLALNRIIFKGGEYIEYKAALRQTHNKADESEAELKTNKVHS